MDQVIMSQPRSTYDPVHGPVPQVGGRGIIDPVQIQMVPLNVPPGLENLTTISDLFIEQKIDALEVNCGCEMNNKYDIKSGQGWVLFKAKENTDCCTRQCCGPCRSFDMEIRDPHGQEVIHLNRLLACDSVFFPCCLQTMTVTSGQSGHLFGSIEQQWSLLPSFLVKDHAGEVVLRIEGPFCTCSSTCSDVVFDVFSPEGDTKIGHISKQWMGFCVEAYTDADNFDLSFPRDLDVRVKATLIGASLLIDFMYFEDSGNSNNNNYPMLRI